MSTSEKERLHRLIDGLPASELRAAERFLEYLQHVGSASLYGQLMAATLDDEPETPEEADAVREGLADIRTGRTVSHEELKRELDLA
ncbi:MAG: hypothetical protein OXM03_06530 [Chloroflexota bacterium]|nr:hypothetical protein [Chloroflexota bacterium]MDE2840268.1 hypothetical protein [Chloroflexota bacterium]MDE2929376.1 hypothetical protein [Chloroflexota bacterium]